MLLVQWSIQKVPLGQVGSSFERQLFPDSSVGKESTCIAGEPSFIPGSGKIRWKRGRPPTSVFLGFHCGTAGKESACNTGDLGSIPGLGKSPEEGKDYPLQYSGLENSMDCIIHGGHKESDRIERFSLSLSREIRWEKNQGYSKLLTSQLAGALYF